MSIAIHPVPVLVAVAVLLFGFVGTEARAQAPAGAALAEAVECRPRGGLPNVAAKLRNDAGGEVRVAYLGGSITAADGYRPIVTRWLGEQFPHAAVQEINAAIPGTGSTLGVFRYADDVLRHKPDLVFIEFAVNDSAVAPDEIVRAMEGIVRQTWAANPSTDVCFVYTFHSPMLPTLKQGKFPASASAMERVADHYGIPTIHMGLEAARMINDGRMVIGPAPGDAKLQKLPDGRPVFSADGTHPFTETGHKLYGEAMARSLPKCLDAGKPGAHERLEPLDPQNFEAAKMISLDHAKLSGGWTKLPESHEAYAKWHAKVPELWYAPRPGESLTFRFKGRFIGAYDITGPDSGQISVKIDDQPAKLFNRFSSWANAFQRRNVTFADDLSPDSVHTLVVTVSDEDPRKAEQLATRKITIGADEVKRYEPKSWIASKLMLIGDVAE